MAHCVLHTMNQKTSTCFEEVDKASLLGTAKTKMKDCIIQDATSLLSCTSDATKATYMALDLLLKIFHDALDIESPELTKLANPASVGSKRKILAGISIGLLLSLAFFNPWLPPTDYHRRLMEQTQMDKLQTQMDDLRAEVMKTVRAETGAQTEKVAALHRRMAALGQKFKNIEKQSEDNGLRIDNIWEALGPPNEHGTYFDFTPNGRNDKGLFSTDEVAYLQKRADQNFKELNAEFVRLRKELHRVDMRLTNDIKEIKRQI